MPDNAWRHLETRTTVRPRGYGIVTVRALIGIGVALVAIGELSRPSVDPAALAVAGAAIGFRTGALVVRIALAKCDGI